MASNDINLTLEINEPGIRHMDQYFGPWAMLEERFNLALEQVKNADWKSHIEAARGRETPAIGSYTKLDNGIAVIEMVGTMTKYGSSFSAMSNGTIGVRQAVRNAVRDSDITGLLLIVDSPGGSVAGTGDLADEVAKATKKKPVVAFIEDLGASAAYWVASQATRVIANATALVGSIGAYTVIEDSSGASQQQGIKVHVIRSGAMKGAGAPGTEVTPEQLADAQRVIDEIHNEFTKAVMRGRSLSADQVSTLADGRVHIGSNAKKLGLIDEIGDQSSAISMLVGGIPSRAKTGARTEKAMSEETGAPVAKPASFEELKSACDGADPAFLVAQLEAKATAAQATKAWMGELKALADKAKADAEAATKAKLEAEEQAKVSKPGVQPLNADAGKTAIEGDATAKWNEAVAAEMKTGKTKAQAMSAVVKENKALHAAYLAEYNAGFNKTA